MTTPRTRLQTAIAALLASILPVHAFVHHPTSEFKLVRLQDHPVYLSPEAVADRELISQVMAKLDSDLKTIHTLLPRAALAHLATVAFWIEHDNPETQCAVYHPNPDWLQGHGYNTDKAKAIEIGNLRHFLDWHAEQPFLVLHELAHAYHDQVLGWDHPLVLKAFDLAFTSHRYDSVPYIRGRKLRAYALSNHKEYFAELSEAYWGKNDFYPFIRSDLAQFDPAGFQMIEKLWLNP